MRKILLILKISSAFCFIGHGAFGIITKVDWLPFFFAGNISPKLGYTLMPFIGSFDILMGVLILFWPCPAILIWMTFWGIFTALLRPLAGQAEWEFLERAGNYGVPLTFLLLGGWFEDKITLFGKIKEVTLKDSTLRFARLILIVTTAFLLLGHGAFLALMKKDLFVYQLLSVGVQMPKEYLVLVGILEMGMGLIVFFWQPAFFLILIVCWKVFTELFYPLSGSPFWEFIERFGSYGAPLALLLLIDYRKKPQN